MKLITFVIPCYNSAEYMEKAIKSAIRGGEEVEVIIVDDGSTKDNTFEIAKKYESRFPDIVKAVHQENGGHGEAVNTGLAMASGKYFKVIDSDDWVDKKSLIKVMETLKSFENQEEPDMLVCNYVYEKVGAKRKKVVHYRNVFPIGQMFGWDEVGHFKVDQYILMHSVVYRTEVLRESQVKLPAHTFYVDNIFVFEPLLFVEKLYYLDADFYRYFIGREDQSVNETVMISRIDQQIGVTKRMIDYYLEKKPESGRRQRYMLKYLRIMMEVSSIFLIISGTKEHMAKKKELWKYAKKDPKLYRDLRCCVLGQSVNFHGYLGRQLSIAGYKVMNGIIGFN